jgi:hypothetical protein
MRSAPKQVQYLLFLLAAGSLSGCAKENLNDCLTSTGPERTQRIELPDFTRLFVSDNIEVQLEPDSVNYVEWRGGRNMLQQLTARVEGNQLELANRNTCNWVRSSKREITAIVHFTALDHIIHDGFGKITSNSPLRQPYLRIDITDAGDAEVAADVQESLVTLYETGTITISGKTGLLSVENYGFGSVFANNMSAQTVFGNLAGYGEVHVRAIENLGINMSGATDLHFYGQPAHIDTSRTNGASGRFVFHP